MKFKISIDYASCEKQEEDSKRLNEILGTDQIKPVPVVTKKGKEYKVKFKKKLDNKN